jgi:hypothetical protein
VAPSTGGVTTPQLGSGEFPVAPRSLGCGYAGCAAGGQPSASSRSRSVRSYGLAEPARSSRTATCRGASYRVILPSRNAGDAGDAGDAGPSAPPTLGIGTACERAVRKHKAPSRVPPYVVGTVRTRRGVTLRQAQAAAVTGDSGGPQRPSWQCSAGSSQGIDQTANGRPGVPHFGVGYLIALGSAAILTDRRS